MGDLMTEVRDPQIVAENVAAKLRELADFIEANKAERTTFSVYQELARSLESIGPRAHPTGRYVVTLDVDLSAVRNKYLAWKQQYPQARILPDPDEVFIVGRCYDPQDTERWEFCGVYQREHDAVEACKDDTYWVGPTRLNYPEPDDESGWPGAYNPHAQAAARARREERKLT